ncbi:MAG TPA: hypothetical protein VG650_02475 [Mycobacteriales bacterium]|nr:hypothetical protein [Mycobacteriales bacterium]
MSEDYVRPPIVAIELRSQRAAIWRFRIVMGLVMLLLIVAVVLIASQIVHSGDGSGTVGGAQAAGFALLR